MLHNTIEKKVNYYISFLNLWTPTGSLYLILETFNTKKYTLEKTSSTSITLTFQSHSYFVSLRTSILQFDLHARGCKGDVHPHEAEQELWLNKSSNDEPLHISCISSDTFPIPLTHVILPSYPVPNQKCCWSYKVCSNKPVRDDYTLLLFPDASKNNWTLKPNFPTSFIAS